MIIIHRADRHRHGGGVCIYVRNSLTCRKVSIGNNSSTSSVESIWLEVHSRSVPSKILVGCIYRPPSLGVNSVQFLLDMIDHALTLRDHVVVCGDLNINLLDSDHPQSILLSEFIKSRNLLQPIASPTRITCNSATFLVSSERIVRSSHVVDIGISDHSAISLGLCWSKSKPRSSTVLRRSFKRFDPDKFKADLSKAPWSVMDTFDCVDDKTDFFNQLFLQVLDDHAPLRRFRVKKNGCPWVTKDIRDQMDTRVKLLHRFRVTRCIEDWEAYRKQRNRVTALLRVSKKEHFSSLITNKAQPATMWRALKSVLPHSVSSWSSFNVDAKTLATMFNDHFISVSSSAPNSIPPELHCANPTRTCQLPPLSLQPIQPEECEIKLSKLQPRKSTGLDGIPASMLKIASPVIALPVCSIINTSISTCSLPSIWKKALVKPLHKGGSRDALSNYRPISLLPVTSKVLESVIRDQVMSHLLDHNLLSPWQSGFRPGHSTTTTLLHVTSEWYSALDQGFIVGAVFLDIAKAFDTVNHTLLLSRLADLGFDHATCEWFSCYLRDRHQCTAIDGNFSDEAVVPSGVPQGSVLGPLLFTLFVNSLPSHLEGVSTVMFADDTTLYVIGKSAADISAMLSYALDSAHKWLLESGLRLNAAKTKCMLIHSSRRRSLSPLDVQLNGTHIQQVQNYKYLGVVISDTLSWSQHIDLVRSKAAKGIGLLRRLSWFLPRQALCTMYNAYILPHLTYADAVWGTCTQGQSRSLEHLQNYAARIILRRRVGASATDMRRELNWPTLTSRRAASEAVAAYQSVSGHGPAYLSALFQQCARTHQHATRSASCRGIRVPQVRTELGKKAFAFRGALRWNGLPVSIRTSKSNDISSSIKSHLLTYSI